MKIIGVLMTYNCEKVVQNAIDKIQHKEVLPKIILGN